MSTDKTLTKEEIDEIYKIWNTNLTIDTINNEIKLPKDGERNILITSALPYVNNVPHLGNIIGSVLSADVFVRYCRLRKYNAIYICGTDEYGTATETKALEEGVQPSELCEKYNRIHCEIYKWFNISFDKFGRTTTEQQKEIAQDIFWKAYKNGYCLENIMEQLYCQKCERFLADRFVEGTCPHCAYDDARGDQCDKCGKLINAPDLKNAKCKLCGLPPIVKQSKHLFLDLPKLETKLKQWTENTTNNEKNCWTQTAKVITNSWLKDGLKPRCISRDLKWGTQVPLDGYKDKVFYVWFDAPIGYLSITSSYTKDWEKWWKNPDNVDLYQFMAKDNVPFHGIIFPATQFATEENFTFVKHLIATEYLNYEDSKFSKSRGIGIFGNDVATTNIDSDIWRFYLLYIRPETQDSSFNWDDLMTKNNSELLNNLGNFINRALIFLVNNFASTIPKITLNDDDLNLISLINLEINSYIECLEKVKLRDAIRHILNISRIGNQHIQSCKPWLLVKGNDDERSRSGSVMALCANIAALLSILLKPYTPDTSEKLQTQLNIEKHTIDINGLQQYLKEGHKLGNASPLFRKLEQKEIDILRDRFKGIISENKLKTAATKTANNNITTIKTMIDENLTIENINAMITEQGNKIRELKLNGIDKCALTPEIKYLTDLKERLSILTGVPIVNNSKNNKKKVK